MSCVGGPMEALHEVDLCEIERVFVWVDVGVGNEPECVSVILHTQTRSKLAYDFNL